MIVVHVLSPAMILLILLIEVLCMFWLCFYNGFEKPLVECAFAHPYMVNEYALQFIPDDSVPNYFVFYRDSSQVIPLKEFLSNEKEY